MHSARDGQESCHYYGRLNPVNSSTPILRFENNLVIFNLITGSHGHQNYSRCKIDTILVKMTRILLKLTRDLTRIKTTIVRLNTYLVKMTRIVVKF